MDDNSDAAVEYAISAVPTFIFSNGDDVVARMSGADPDKLKSYIEELEGQ